MKMSSDRPRAKSIWRLCVKNPTSILGVVKGREGCVDVWMDVGMNGQCREGCYCMTKHQKRLVLDYYSVLRTGGK